MARLLGVDIPDNKKIKIALTRIYGVGRTKALEVLENVGIDPEMRASELTPTQLKQIQKYIEDNIPAEGQLRQQIFRNIKRLKDINAYRGRRHRIGLPVRGQRTRVNARTRKGRAIAVGGLKVKITKK